MGNYLFQGNGRAFGFGAVGGALLNASQLVVAQRSNPVYQQQLGWAVPAGWPTDVSSAAFATRVAAFQAGQGGLVVDGMLGPKTLAAFSAAPGMTPPAASTFGTGWFWLAALGGLGLLAMSKPKKGTRKKKKKVKRNPTPERRQVLRRVWAKRIGRKRTSARAKISLWRRLSPTARRELRGLYGEYRDVPRDVIDEFYHAGR